VVGITPSQSSRDVLAQAGVAESYNFARFLGHLKDRRGALGPVGLAPGDLIVIDEASMISNPDNALRGRAPLGAGCRCQLICSDLDNSIACT
jgi:hypothetical protein